MKKFLSVAAILAVLSAAPVYAQVTMPELAMAIQVGDNQKVETYLNENGDPNATLLQGQTLVMAAVGANNAAALDTLIAHGADVNKPSIMVGQEIYPLFSAISLQNATMVTKLLDAGANTNFKVAGQPFMKMARMWGNADVIKALSANVGRTQPTTNTSQSTTSPTENTTNTDLGVNLGSQTINPAVTSKTILSQLSQEDIDKAKADAKNGKYALYPLFEKGRSTWQDFGLMFATGMTKAPIRLSLATPYSQLRHLYYQEQELYVPVSDADKAIIYSDRDRVYIVPWAYNDFKTIPTVIKNIVIKKDGNIYHPIDVSEPIVTQWYQRTSPSYAFDINLFDGRPMEIIAIDAATDEKLVMPINAEFYKKRHWY